MFAGNFAPRGWAFCDGQLLAVSQNDALVSLFGTIYGGDGRTTFGLPDLRGRVPIHAGHGPGLSDRRLGSKAGSEHVTLTANQIPNHSHRMTGLAAAGSDGNPGGNQPSQAPITMYSRAPVAASIRGLHPSSVAQVGGSQNHTNLQPFLCIYFIVALVGIYPSRH